MERTNDSCRVVTRRGVVASVSDSVANIEITQHGACASCHVKAICTALDATTKTVTVPARDDLRPGTTVELSMEERFGWLGVLLAFVIPLLIVVGTFFLLRRPFSSEEYAALAGLCALVPYFGLIYLARGWFAGVIRFEAAPVGIHTGTLRFEEGSS